MKDIDLKILSTFHVHMRVHILNGIESSLEWKLYYDLKGRFNPIALLTSSIPYKLNQ